MNAASALILGLYSVGGAPQGEILDFSAKWCGPCQTVAPLVEKLKRQGYPIRKVDVNEHPELAQKYHIDTIPQFVLVIDGRERTRVKGIQSESSLKRLLAQIPKVEKTEESPESEAVVAKNDGPFRIGGIPISILGQPKSFVPEEIETIRGQNESAPSLELVATSNVATPQQATVRLSVNNDGSVNKGTGTIIESNSDRTLAITCGHLFRYSNDQTRIAVEIFEDGQPKTFQARLVRFDDRADVGVIAFAPEKILPCIRIASDPRAVLPRDLVSSMGCGQGNDPTQWQMFVKSVDGYVGKSITECTQAPIDGRSGGGLFNRAGELIGICMAADKNNNTGLYAGLSEIHSLLDQLSLTSLYHTSNAVAKPISTEVLQNVAGGDRPEFSPTPEMEAELAVNELAKTMAPKHPVRLSEDEIAAIAASLQMSGPGGVSISIEAAENLPGGHRVTIVNRVVRNSPSIARVEAPKNSSLRPESLDWSNLLESRETNKPVNSADHDLPEWARDRTDDTTGSLPYRRNLH